MYKTVALHTLGCKLNYSETSTIAKQFAQKGLKILDFGEKADIFVLNTCTVTENADKECRQLIRSVLRQNPETFVVVTGCYAQLQPGEISTIEGVDLVLGSNEKFKLLDYLGDVDTHDLSCLGKKSKTEIYVSPLDSLDALGEAFSADTDSRTRAFLKIQDGCDYNCSFCTIPLARGKSRSLSLSSVLDNAKIIDSGYKEIVLTGVNTGDYKFSDEEKNYKLIDLLYELDKLEIERIRISSIEPNLLTDEIIALVKSSEKLCNHFHIPLQSGDSEILKLMKRRYNLELYRDLIYKLNEEISDVGIGVDVIVGFPGEKEENFNNTYKFLDSLPISYLHVFTYSERKNTFAVTLPGNVDIRDRKIRSQVLRNLSAKKRFEFYSKHIGNEMSVLFEGRKNGTIEGWTGNYIRVKTGYFEGIHNSINLVKLLDTNGAKAVSGIPILN